MIYQVVLNGQYDLQEVTEDIRVSDSLGDISLHLSFQFVVSSDFPNLEEGHTIDVIGVPYGETSTKTLYSGVVWATDETDNGSYKTLAVDVYERTIYLKKSEEEYIFLSGQTAADRIRRYASDWNIPLGNIPNTITKLEKAVYRAQPISSMIQKDLNETATKGGKLYIPRISLNRLDLYEIGSNMDIWLLEDVETKTKSRTLENAVTKVKVLGKEVEGKSSPVIATVSKDTNKYGTLQKIIQDEKITKKSDAETAANKLLFGVEESSTVSAPGINTLRAGDRVKIDGKELIITSLNQPLAEGATMSLQLGSIDYVRRKYFGETVG